MTNDVRLDLIDAYINKSLSNKQKLEFYKLMENDSEFRILVKDELELQRQLMQLKTHIDDATKARVLHRIEHQSKSYEEIMNAIRNYIVKWSLRMAVPSPVLPYLNNNIIRRCV